MTQFLNYKTATKEDVLELKDNSVSYLDLSNESVSVFRNPLDKPTPKLLCGKSTLFFVFDETIHLFEEDKPFEFENITFELKPQDYVLISTLKKIKPKAKSFLTNKKHRTKLLASVAFLLCFVIVNSFWSGSETKYAFESNLEEISPNIEGKDLIAIRLKLAKQSLDEKKYNLTLNHVDKILAISPNHSEAIELKTLASQGSQTLKVSAQKDLKKDIRLDNLIKRVTTLATNKDYQGALFLLEQILDNHPDHSEANRLAQTIRKEMKLKTEKDKQEKALQAVHVEKAQKLWKTGESHFKKEELKNSWISLNESLNILEENKLNPFFRYELSEMIAEVEQKLINKLKPTMNEAREFRKKGDRSKGLSKSRNYKAALGKYLSVKEEFVKYPFLNNEISTTVTSLNYAIKPYYTEAQVIRDYDGCCAAKSHYKKVLNYAGYDIVPYYKQAKEALDQCPCK